MSRAEVNANVKLAESINPCPACKDAARGARAIYAYALAYLCTDHREVWIARDDMLHALGRGAAKCPHHPEPCVLGRMECEERNARDARDTRARMVRVGGARS